MSTAGSASGPGPRVHKWVQGCAAVLLVRKVAEGCGCRVGALAAGLPGQGLTRLGPSQLTGAGDQQGMQSKGSQGHVVLHVMVCRSSTGGRKQQQW